MTKMMFGMMMRLAQLNPKIRWHGVPKFLTHRVKMVGFDPENKVLMARGEVNIRKISRKRFERIAMALGVPPRDARWIADLAHELGLEYKDALRADPQSERCGRAGGRRGEGRTGRVRA